MAGSSNWLRGAGSWTKSTFDWARQKILELPVWLGATSKRRWIVWLVICVAGYALEHSWGHAENDGIPTDFSSRFYATLTQELPVGLPSHVQLVVIDDPNRDPNRPDCGVRTLLGRFIRSLKDLGPLRLVLDYEFPLSATPICPSRSNPSIDILEEALKELHASSIVVTACADESFEKLRLGPHVEEKASKLRAVIVRPTATFQIGGGAQRTVCGVTISARDLRILPIGWNAITREADDSIGNSTPEFIFSLAMKGAIAREPGIEENWRFNPEDRYPFVHLRRSSDWGTHFSRMESLCEATSALVCENLMRDTRLRMSFAGAVVVVGSFTARDRRKGIDGKDIPGVQLHADYIESVLSNLVYSPVPDWVGVGASVLLFCLVEFLHQRVKSPLLATVYSLLAVLVVLFLSVVAVLWIMRIYVPLIAPNALLILFVYWFHPLWKRFFPITKQGGVP